MLFRSLKSPGTRNSVFLVENCVCSKVFSLRLNLKIEGRGKERTDDSKQMGLLENGGAQCLSACKGEEERGQRAS